MNYQRHYGLLIERARARTLSGYSELHHVLPRCLGGNDESDNLVRLTAEEHFVAHQLLAKIHPTNVKLLFAALNMTVDAWNKRAGNKRYSWLKRKHSEIVRGANHHNFGKVLSEEQKRKISKSLTGRLFSEETRKLMSVAQAGEQNGMFGKKHKPETLELYSSQRRGANNSFYGKKHSEESKLKMRMSIPVKVCPHCGKEGKGGGMTRFHFENCVSITKAERSLHVS